MKRFNGPVYPVSPSFDENENIEFDSTNKYINYLEDNGAKVIMTTAGTSQFNLLTKEEIRELNLTVSRFRGQKILGLPQLSTLHLLEEIDYLNNHLDGNDISLLILFPERYYSDKQIVNFFKDVCEKSNFPILVHGNLLKKGMGGSYEYSKPLLSQLSEIDGFIGMKEEAANIMHSTNNIPKGLEVIVAGGSMKRFWSLEPHGATTYLVGVGSFNPQWEEQFYNEYYQNMFSSKNIITLIENPLFEIFMSYGWHLCMRTSLKHMGFIMGDRRPFHQPTDEQQQNIIKALNKILE